MKFSSTITVCIIVESKVKKELTILANQNRIDWVPAKAAAVASGCLAGINQSAISHLVFRVRTPCVRVCLTTRLNPPAYFYPWRYWLAFPIEDIGIGDIG